MKLVAIGPENERLPYIPLGKYIRSVRRRPPGPGVTAHEFLSSWIHELSRPFAFGDVPPSDEVDVAWFDDELYVSVRTLVARLKADLTTWAGLRLSRPIRPT